MRHGVFPSFSFLFSLDKDANPLLPADLPGLWLPANGVSAATLTWAHHQDTLQPGWQVMRNITVHPVGGKRRFGSHVTEGYNQDGGVLQQPARLRHEGRCGAPIPRRWSTGRCEVGFSIPAQWWGRDYTRFLGPNVVSCKIVWKVS